MLVYLKLQILRVISPVKKSQEKFDGEAFANLIVLLCSDLGSLKGPVMKMGQFFAQIGDFPKFKNSLIKNSRFI